MGGERPEPRSPGRSRGKAAAAARRARASSSLPGLPFCRRPPPPRRGTGARRSASARGERQRRPERRPSLRAGAAVGGAERGGGCECGGAAPAPRCAEPSRAASGNGGAGARRHRPGEAGRLEVRGVDAAARSFPLCARAVVGGCGGCWGGEAAALLRVSVPPPTHTYTHTLPPAAACSAGRAGGSAGDRLCGAGAEPLRVRGSPVSVCVCVFPLSPAAAGRGVGRGAQHRAVFVAAEPRKRGGGGKREINKKTFSPSEINRIGFARL